MRIPVRTSAAGLTGLCFAAVSLAACSGNASAPALVCAPGPSQATEFLSELADEGRLFSGTFSADDEEFWFFKKTGPRNSEIYRIFLSRRDGNSWTAADTVDLGETPSDLYPALSPDGRTLVFSSYRRAPGDTTATPSASLWLSQRGRGEGGGWSEPAPIAGAGLPGHYHSGPHFRPDGTLGFNRTTPDWSSDTRLALGLDAPGAAPAATVPDTLTASWADWRDDAYVWYVQLAPDGETLLLDVSPLDPETGRRGPTDVWISHRIDGEWNEPVRAGNGVNNPDEYDNFAHFSPDGCTLYWTRGFSRFYRIGWRELREATAP